MADNRQLQYVIKMVADDSKLRQQMKGWNWEDIMGTKGKGFGDKVVNDVKGAVNELKGLNVDWTKILGAKEIGQLEQAVTRALQGSRKQLESLALKGDTSGIKETIQLVAGLGEELHSLGSSFDVASLARGMGAFMKVLTPLTSKFEALADQPAIIEKAFDRLFNGTTMRGADQTITKIATAMASLGVDKSAVTNMKQVRSEMDKLSKSSKVKLEIDYGSLSDTDLLSALRNKHNKPTVNLDDLLSFEWGTQLENLMDAKGEKLKSTLANIVSLESKIKTRSGKSPVDEYFFEDTGYDGIEDIKETLKNLAGETDKAVKETINKLDQGVKTIQQSIADKLGKLTAVNIDLTLDEANKTKFKNSIDTFVGELNSNKYGELNTVNIDLNLNEPEKTTNKGRPKSASKKQIEDTKADIQKSLDDTKAKYNEVNNVLADLNKRHGEELAKNQDYDKTPQSARLKGSINKAEAELKSLEKTMSSYSHLLSQMDDYDFAKSVVSDWKKFSSAEQNITASQDRLLKRTREWRNEMNESLRFKYQWKIDGTEDEFDILANALTDISERKPIKLLPDINFMVNAIEEGLSGREISVKLAADGPIKATGGVVGNLGIVPVAATKQRVAFTPPPKPVSAPQEQPRTVKQTTSESQSRVYIDTDTDAIIKYVEEQVKANKELKNLYDELLKDAGITDKQVSAYLNNVRDKKTEIPKEIVKKYGSENIFLSKLKKTKGTVGFNEKLPFFDTSEDILKLRDIINSNPEDETKVKEASEQIKALLVKSVVDSFKGYIQQSKERFAENEKKIQEQIGIKEAARKTYGSDEEKKKRLDIMDSQKEKITGLESNTAIKEYENLLELIKMAKKEGDTDALNSFLKQERETLPAVKQGYQDLIAARERLKELNKEDPNDPNLLKIAEAEQKIASLTRSNQKITRSRQEYEAIGFPLNQLESFVNAKDNDSVYNLIVDKILSQPNIVQSMGAKRKTSDAINPMYLFDTTSQQLMTVTIDMVQKALSIAQKRTEELDRRAGNESLLGDLKNISARKNTLDSIRGWGSSPRSQEEFDNINSLFANELEHARQIGESGATTNQERAYVKFAKAVDYATQAAEGFRELYNSWSSDDKESLLVAENDEEWFKQKYNNPVDATKNYQLYTNYQESIKILKDSIERETNPATGEREEYGIRDVLTRQLRGYVFRVTLVDEKGSRTVDVGTQNLVEQGRLNKPDKSYKAGSNNMAEFLKNLPDDLSEIADIKFYKTPGGRRSLDQPSNVETPISQETSKKNDKSREVAKAKQIIANANRSIDESANVVTVQEILDDANKALESSSQALDTIQGQINSITGGTDAEKYKQDLIQKRNSLKTITDGDTKSTSIALLSNKAFDEANKIIDEVTEEADIAQRIAKNPFDTESQKLFKGDLPSGLKRLTEIVQQRDILNKTLPKSHEEALQIQTKLQELSNEEKALKQSINQWTNGINSKKDDAIKSANIMKQQSAPKLAQDAQKKLVGLVDQAMSLSQQLEADPNNEELKTQMQDVVNTISQLTVLYKDLLNKYNITTKGFLGNENQKKLDIAQKIYENPADQSLWGEFGKVPDAVQKASELLRRDAELTRQLRDLPSDIVEIDNELARLKAEYDNAQQTFNTDPSEINRKTREKAKKAYKEYRNKNKDRRDNLEREYRDPIEQERLQVAKEYNRERNKILQWIQKQKSSVGTGIFAGLGNSGQKFKNVQSLFAGWGSNVKTRDSQVVNTEPERNRINDEMSQLNTLMREAEIYKQIESDKKELVHLATRQLEIEREIADTNTTTERKSELDTEYKNNKTRMSELGARTRKFMTTSVDSEKLQGAYVTVIDSLIDQQEESDNKIREIASSIEREKQRLGRLEAERTQDAVAEGKRRTQDSAIQSVVSLRASNLATDNPKVYAQLRDEVASQYPVTDFYDYQNPYEHQERAIQAAMQKRAEAYIWETITAEEEQKIINEAIENQKRAIAEKEAQLQAEREHNKAITTERDKLKAEGQITDEMIAARRNATEEIKREAQIIHQYANVNDESSSTDDNRVEYDTHYQDYTGGQAYQYVGDGAYSLNTSGLATEDTLSAIYALLSGDTSRVGLSDSERRVLEEELEAIRGQNNGSLSRNKTKDSTDLDINPSVDIAQEIEKKMVDILGKSLPLKDIQSIVGSVTSKIMLEQNNGGKSIDREKFYEKNYTAIIDKAFNEVLIKRFRHLNQVASDTRGGKHTSENATEYDKILKLLTERGVYKGAKPTTVENESQPESAIVETTEIGKEVKEVSESIMTIGKAITIINNAIGKSTAKTTTGMAKAYADKIHNNTEAVEAAKLLYNTPDSELTSKYGKNTKEKLKAFRDAWANKPEEQPKIPVEPVIQSGAVAEEVKENVAEVSAKAKVEPIVDNKISDDDIIRTTLPDGSPFEGTEQEYDELVSLLNYGDVEVDITPTVQPGAVDKALAEDINNNSLDTSIVKATFADGTSFEGSEAELQEMIAAFGEPISKIVEASNQQLENAQNITTESIKQVKNEQMETAESVEQLNNTEALKAREAEINARLLADDKLKAAQDASMSNDGGIIGIMNDLAKENTLREVLNAIGKVAKGSGSSVSVKGNSAQDLLMRLMGLRDVSVGQDKERVAYIDLKTGAMTDSIEGQRGGIDNDTLTILRKAYQGIIDFNAQVHTHGDSDNPEDRYFSGKDLSSFKTDFENGIKKQILVSTQGLTILDLSEVEKLSDDTLTKFGGGKTGYESLLKNDLGIKYISQAWENINPEIFVKMLGLSDTSSTSKINGIDTVVSKLQDARKKMGEAIGVGYLSDKDTNLAEFDEILKRAQEISEGIKKGTTSYEEQKIKLDELVNSAIRYSDVISRTIGKNRRAYAGDTAVDSVNKQRNQIIGMFKTEDEFNSSDIALVQQYNQAVKDLNTTYQTLAKNQKLQDEGQQQALSQQASRVRALGKSLISSIKQTEQLTQWVEQTGTYMKNGEAEELGGISQTLDSSQIKNLESTMRNYVQNTLGQANVENVKFNSTQQQLTYTFRTSKDTVADMVVKYDDATRALYAYNKQERESLTGLKGFLQSLKSKTKSILQYTTSITSIYRVLGELRKGIQYIREIDSALTELKKVTDETEETYDRFLNTAAKTADKVGSTIKDVVSSTADFARLGYSIQEATMMAETAQVLMNVSEFTDISTATDSLISSIQAFKYTAEESMDVVDILNTIGKQICRGYIVIYNRADNYNG